MTSESKYSELKAAAMAATQGPWNAFISGNTCAVHSPGDKRCGDIINWPGFDCRQNAANNAAFIAAANPAAVLELLAERNADKKRIAELERSETQLIEERDVAHDAIDAMYEAATGERPEWSNWFVFSDAIEEVAQVRAKLATPVRLPDIRSDDYHETGWFQHMKYYRDVERSLRAAGFNVEGDEQ